jgi:tetratricopeptide (TPR) repeat protein
MQMQWSIRLYPAILALSVFSTPLPAADWSPLNRTQAIERLDSRHADERRLALGRLAEIGTQQDVPFMLIRLWDEDDMVRGMAEQALWGLWMRANDSTVDPMFQVGIDLVQQDKIESALEQFNAVINAQPNFAEAWNKRGDAYMALGDYDSALADYQHALELNPYHFGVMESCGVIWMERRDARKAAEYFRRALDLNPNLFGVAMTLRELEQRLSNDRI